MNETTDPAMNNKPQIISYVRTAQSVLSCPHSQFPVRFRDLALSGWHVQGSQRPFQGKPKKGSLPHGTEFQRAEQGNDEATVLDPTEIG